jgi:hypothetical protein
MALPGDIDHRQNGGCTQKKEKKKDLFISISSISRLSCAFSVVASSYFVCI